MKLSDQPLYNEPNHQNMNTEQVKNKILSLIQSENFCVLSTQGNNKPYSSLVAFIVSEDLNYFKYLHELLDNKGHLLTSVLKVAKTGREYFSEKQTISNFIKKINKPDVLLPIKKVEEIYGFYESLIDEGFKFEDRCDDEMEYSLKINSKIIFFYKI